MVEVQLLTLQSRVATVRFGRCFPTNTFYYVVIDRLVPVIQFSNQLLNITVYLLAIKSKYSNKQTLFSNEKSNDARFFLLVSLQYSKHIKVYNILMRNVGGKK